jgi:polysaccharide export outer membrane protein
MKLFFTTLLFGVLTVPCSLSAQQDAARPVPSPAPPPSATAGGADATAPLAADTPRPAAQPAAGGRYIVGPDDSISVNVWREPSLSGVFPVRPDGMISLALVGDIVAAGRTPMDLANDLTERLKRFITDPTVTVTVLAVNSKRVFLLGEVVRTGAVPLTSSLTPLQAISAAGGLTPYANRKHIYILRGEQGRQKKIPFDYNKAIKDGNLQGVVLMPGDTIVVP